MWQRVWPDCVWQRGTRFGNTSLFFESPKVIIPTEKNVVKRMQTL